jgi:hydrogenase/urease accessory protein HupE
MPKRTLLLRAAWLALLLPALVQAHEPGLSALSLRLEPDRLTARLTLARPDVERLRPLDADADRKVSQQEFAAQRLALEELGLRAVELESDGKTLAPDLASLEWEEPTDAVHFHLAWPRPQGTQLVARASLLQYLPRGHRQHATLRNERDVVLATALLDAGQPSFACALEAAPAASGPRSFGHFLVLGIEHIVTGYDHLVFLLGLLIVGGSFRSVVMVVTAFTLAHSVTLALATLDWIRIPASVVEPLIAASIIYVGVENIFRRDLERRWPLTFAFGLVHGCGFASVLRDLGIGADGASPVVPLLSFNLGVEAGQVAIAALLLPIIWKLKERPAYKPRVLPACSILISLAGAWWLVERLFL